MKKDATEKALDVLQRLNVVRKDQREKVKAIMEYAGIKDVMEAIRFCVDQAYFELIGQFDEDESV